MRTLSQRQIRNLVFPTLLAIVLSCVSKTSPDGRVNDSLRVASDSTFSITGGVNAPFTFAMVGDLHIGQGDTSRLTSILNAAATEGDQFILFLGDNVDQGQDSDVQAFQSAISAAGWAGKTFSVVGNHDVFYDGWQYYFNRTGASTYTFTAGNSRFIAIDSADGTLGSRQTAWLRQQLAASTATNTFIFSHYAPLVPGVETWLRLASETESLNLMSLCSRFGVKGWFGAHYHSYLNQEIGGVAYVIAGGGGGRRMDPVKDYFFVQVSVNGSQVSYQLKTVP